MKSPPWEPTSWHSLYFCAFKQSLNTWVYSSNSYPFPESLHPWSTTLNLVLSSDILKRFSLVGPLLVISFIDAPTKIMIPYRKEIPRDPVLLFFTCFCRGHKRMIYISLNMYSDASPMWLPTLINCNGDFRATLCEHSLRLGFNTDTVKPL